MKIKKFYDYFNKTSTNNKKLSGKNGFRKMTESIIGSGQKKVKKLIFNPTPLEENHTMNIFTAFQECLRENILKHIPSKPLWKQEGTKVQKANLFLLF